MDAIVTPEEMGGIDATAPEPVEVLIGRAGQAVAREALRMLGGAYGHRVVVVAVDTLDEHGPAIDQEPAFPDLASREADPAGVVGDRRSIAVVKYEMHRI